MHLHRYIASLVALIALSGAMVFAAPSASMSVTDARPNALDWPPMQVTYETIISAVPESRMPDRRTTRLTYISCDEWRSETVDGAFGAGAPESFWEFKDGVFTQDLKEAGMVFTEEIPEGNHVAPERWLSQGRMQNLEQNLEELGYQRTPVNKRQVRYEYAADLPCNTMEQPFQPAGCDAADTVPEVETVIARTDISTVPFPIEYRYTLDGDLRIHATVLEVVLLDHGSTLK